MNRSGLCAGLSLWGVSALLVILSSFGWEAQRLLEEGLAAAMLGFAPFLMHLATLPLDDGSEKNDRALDGLQHNA